MVKLWREDLGKVNQKAAEALADPAQYKNLFPNMDAALQAEQHQANSNHKLMGAQHTWPRMHCLAFTIPIIPQQSSETVSCICSRIMSFTWYSNSGGKLFSSLLLMTVAL